MKSGVDSESATGTEDDALSDQAGPVSDTESSDGEHLEEQKIPQNPKTWLSRTSSFPKIAPLARRAFERAGSSVSGMVAAQNGKSTKDEEPLPFIKQREELKQEVIKQKEEITQLNQELAGERVQVQLLKEKYHGTVADNAKLTEHVADLEMKLAEERGKRLFFADKYQDVQRLYLESLENVAGLREQSNTSGKQSQRSELAQLEQRLEEERARSQYLKEKVSHVQNLYQESLESIAALVEKSQNAEKLYRVTQDDLQHFKRKAQEAGGLYLESQESAGGYKKKVQSAEQSCREARSEAEYFKLKAAEMERAYHESQGSMARLEEKMGAILRESK